MEIRSVTVGCDLAWDNGRPLERAGKFLQRAVERLGAAGITVQTTRLCTQPLDRLVARSDLGRLPEVGRQIEAEARAAGIGYVALGTVRSGPDLPAYARALPRLIQSTESVFASVSIGSRAEGIDARACEEAAVVIVEVGATTPLGFGNLRFAASANCPPNIPFFPASYHGGGPPRFAIALQAADVLVRVLAESGPPAQVEARLIEELGRAAGAVEALAVELAAEAGWEYAGIDLSPAPFPRDDASVAGALERLGLDRFGGAGTLWATAFVTRALRQVPVKRCGFSGLMLPVLEDSVLARRTAEGLLTLPELLLYSAVCGTGLDTVPLPGDARATELAAVLLDVAALAVTLDKPLTARLLPVPGARPGDLTAFDFPYFVNTRVLPLKGYAAAGLFERVGRPEA